MAPICIIIRGADIKISGADKGGVKMPEVWWFFLLIYLLFLLLNGIVPQSSGIPENVKKITKNKTINFSEFLTRNDDAVKDW